ADLGRTLFATLGPFDLFQFLVDLRARAGHVGPIEADPRRPPLDLLGTLQSGEGEGDAGEGAVVHMALALGRLERFPAGALRGVAEDMRVAADHLGRD